MASDGHVARHGQEMITQKSAALIGDLQEVALKLGKGAMIKRRDGSPYNPDGIYWNLGTCRTAFRQHERVKVTDYDGPVYCAEVPNGTLMVRRNGKPCWSCNSNNAEIGDEILQPGKADGGTVAADVIATLWDFVPVKFLLDNLPDCPTATGVAKVVNLLARLAGSKHRVRAYQDDPLAPNLVDAAIAKPVYLENVIRDVLGIQMPTGHKEVELGDAIIKSGRTTGVTRGTVTQVGATLQVMYGNSIAMFEDQVVSNVPCGPGDSGSIVLADDGGGDVVGLLFAGAADGATMIMCRIQNVLDLLGVEISVG